MVCSHCPPAAHRLLAFMSRRRFDGRFYVRPGIQVVVEHLRDDAGRMEAALCDFQRGGL
jgi:hypothetical protein